MLVGVVTLLSAFVKNVGALAIMMPIAFQLARRTGTSPSSLLMPMAFGSLLGGLMTLIGTSPNVIVARMRAELLGEPFHMFYFLRVGAGIAALGVGFLVLGYRLLPSGRKGSASIEAAFNTMRLGRDAQAAIGDGLSLDAFAVEQDGLAAAEVDIGRGQVAQALMVAVMVVVGDEGLDLGLERAGQVVVLEQDAVLQGLVPALDLALGLRMAGRAADMVDGLARRAIRPVRRRCSWARCRTAGVAGAAPVPGRSPRRRAPAPACR